MMRSGKCRDEVSDQIERFGVRPWIVWATGLLAYIVAVLDRTTLGVSGLEAADRFGAGPAVLSTFVVLQVIVYAGAQVPAGLLLDRSWTGVGSVPVLGPQDLSPDDLARIMTEELGRPVRYHRESLDELRTTMLGYGLDAAFVEGMVAMKRAKDEGLDAGVAGPARSGTEFAQWCAHTLKPAVLAAPEAADVH